MPDNVRNPYSRVFTIPNRGPAGVATYQGRARAMGPSYGFGDRSPIREPDPGRYGAFRIIDSIKGERDLPTLPLEGMYQYTLSEFLRLGRVGCPFDVQVHFGKCQDPRDFNGGWDKILVLEGADASTWSASELGALQQGDDSQVLETLDLTGLDMYEIKRLNLSALAGSAIVQEVLDVVICDSVSCGACGLSSNGCQRFFAIQTATGGSPGLPAELISSQDGGTTIVENNITTLPANMNPSALACVGTRLAVISSGDDSLHYADIVDIINDAPTWAENATVINGPNDIFSRGSTFTWVVADGGFVYFFADISAAGVAQTSGSVTSQNLNAINGVDDLNLVAVGASNAVIYTTDGGTTWSAVTGPAVGVALTTVKVLTPEIWLVGTAGGELYYTLNSGLTWTEIAFPGSGAGTVEDISFSTPAIGYMSHTLSGAGRILRTIDGGATWYVLPEGTGAIPTNQRINAIAACGEDVNVIYAGGLGTSTDGILLKGA